ncbi:unnamed protein product, partial [marine sediment metagenome]
YYQGPSGVQCRSLRREGALEWEWTQKLSGRAALTTSGLFVPVGDEIVKLSLNKGPDGKPTVLARYRVPSTGNDPLGNLSSNGKYLVALGMDRLRVLSSIEQLIAALARRIESGELAARLERMSLLARRGQLAEAADDLRAAVAQVRRDQGADAALELLARKIESLALPRKDPQLALRLSIEPPGDWGQASEQVGQLRTAILMSALKTIQQAKQSDATAVLLELAAAGEREDVLLVVSDTIVAVADEKHADRLRDALADDNAAVREVAATALGAVLK